MIARLAIAVLAWAGRRRLRAGYCPACYSSPPRLECPICEGDHEYGPALRSRVEERWRTRWAAYVRVVR